MEVLRSPASELDPFAKAWLDGTDGVIQGDTVMCTEGVRSILAEEELAAESIRDVVAATAEGEVVARAA